MIGQFSPAARIIERSPESRRLKVFLCLAVVDILFNTAAGSAAALAGAKVNSWSRTSTTAHYAYSRSQIASYGARAAAMKVGILTLLKFGGRFGGVNFATGLLLSLVSSRFGMAVLVTGMLSSLVLGTVNESLLLAALVAALFLGTEMSTINPAGGLQLAVIFWDAVAGYAFARMARRGNFEICSNKAGVSAGMIYGMFTALKSILVVFAQGPTRSYSYSYPGGTKTEVSNNFESYTVDDPGMRSEHGTSSYSETFLGSTTSHGSSFYSGAYTGTSVTYESGATYSY